MAPDQQRTTPQEGRRAAQHPGHVTSQSLKPPAPANAARRSPEAENINDLFSEP
jgi:hypothetical protein